MHSISIAAAVAKEAREQPENDANSTEHLNEKRTPKKEFRWRVAEVGKRFEETRRGPNHDFTPAVDQQVPADGNTKDQPGERNSGIVQRLQERQKKFRFSSHLRHSLSSPSGE